MVRKHYISPSLLAADFGNLEQACGLINRSNADWLHVDVMDGVFVPNISFGFPVMKALRQYCTKPLDVHLMITRPENYAERFCDAGAWSVGFHLEAVEDPLPILEKIKAKGVRTCLTINPDIPVQRLEPYIDKADMLLVMSVYAGFGGQAFLPESLDKVRQLRKIIDARGLDTLIEVDGGINRKWAPALWQAGADALVAGSAVFQAKDPFAAIDLLKET